MYDEKEPRRPLESWATRERALERLEDALVQSEAATLDFPFVVACFSSSGALLSLEGPFRYAIDALTEADLARTEDDGTFEFRVFPLNPTTRPLAG